MLYIAALLVQQGTFFVVCVCTPTASQDSKLCSHYMAIGKSVR